MPKIAEPKREVFNTKIRADILTAAKMLAVSQGRQYAALFEEALIDVIAKHGREDLIPERAQGRLWR